MENGGIDCDGRLGNLLYLITMTTVIEFAQENGLIDFQNKREFARSLVEGEK